MTEETLVAVGKFGGAHGLKGEMFVIPFGSDAQRLCRLKTALIEVEGSYKEIQILSARISSGKLKIKVAGYDTREEARVLTNRELFLRKNQLENLPDGEYYAFELEGMLVQSVEGRELGTLIKVEQYPANDVYLIKDSSERLLRFPAVKEFVKQIDTEKKIIVIDPPQGWNEITES